jgi:hypothetical protein
VFSVIYKSAWWSLETAGWAVDVSGESTALMPGDLANDAALIVSAFRKADGTISTEELWIMSGAASPSDVQRLPVTCGEFVGYAAAYGDEDGVYWRIWWLACSDLHVYATFNCPLDHAGEHDAVLDWMLSSLTVVPAVTNAPRGA